MNQPFGQRAALSATGIVLVATVVGGCGKLSNTANPTGTAAGPLATASSAVPGHPGNPINQARERGKQEGRPVAVLIVDAARGENDRSARSAFESTVGKTPSAIPVVLDLGESRNRALAAPLRGLERPTLALLSPGGLIVSHDVGPLTEDLLRARVASANDRWRSLDEEHDRLVKAVTAAGTGPHDVGAVMALTDFLLGLRNDREAIPYLKRVADDESADLAVRVRAWTALGRAHLAVVEPEKARHAAQALIATLGPRTPEAIAGGNLVRGLQDTKAKRYDRAADELRAAVAAAPESPYGKEAAELLAKLPRPAVPQK